MCKRLPVLQRGRSLKTLSAGFQLHRMVQKHDRDLLAQFFTIHGPYIWELTSIKPLQELRLKSSTVILSPRLPSRISTMTYFKEASITAWASLKAWCLMDPSNLVWWWRWILKPSPCSGFEETAPFQTLSAISYRLNLDTWCHQDCSRERQHGAILAITLKYLLHDTPRNIVMVGYKNTLLSAWNLLIPHHIIVCST